MAYMGFVQQTIDLTGIDELLQGSTYLRVFTVRNSAGAPVPMTDWTAVVPRCQFRDAPINDSGAVTGLPQPTMSWLAGGAAGEIQMLIPSNGWPTTQQKYGGVYQIEVTHNTALGGAPAVARPFTGSLTISKEVTT